LKRIPAALLLLLGAGCSAGLIEDGVFYSTKGYRVAIPGPTWQIVAGGGADLQLQRVEPKGGGPEGGREINAGIVVHATCGGNPPRRTLSVLARHITFGLEGRELLDRGEVTLGGRSAWRSLIQGRLDGAPVKVEAYVMKDQRCVYDFLYVAPPEGFAAGEGEFRAFVQSFVGP
jgi:hypothetical protein